MLRLFSSLYIFLLLFFLMEAEVLFAPFFSVYESSYSEDLAQDYNSLFLIVEELRPKITNDEWLELQKKVTDQSNIPMESRQLNEWNLSDDAIQLVEAGGVFVEDYDDDILYKKISDNTVVRVGPIKTVQSVEDLTLYLEFAVLLVAGLATLLWSGWEQYKIKLLAAQTQRFSEGNMDSRAPLGFVSIPKLSLAFNIMAERVERLFASHKHLTNAVSHELRSPIARARFQLELLDGESDEKLRNQLLKELEDSLNNMDSLVDEMLSYAKMERAELSPVLEKHDVIAWLREQKANLSYEIKNDITLDVPDTTFDSYFDSFLVARLLRNLVSNADRYTSSRIIVGIKKEGTSYLLWVDDDGCGIPQHEYDNLFKPFVRLDQSRNRESGGYGLGLAIASQIARCHAGTLSVTASPLGGARFTFLWSSPGN